MSALINVAINDHHYGVIHALTSCHLTIYPKDMIAIVGPNGGGKSTLMKLLAGLFEPTQGSVKRQNLRPQDIAYLAQRTEIDRTFPLKVEDVIAMGLWPKTGGCYRLGPQEREELLGILDKVGLNGFAKRSISQLSGGQLQRLFFGRVMAQDAKLILLDEPFTGIDQPTMNDLISLVHQWHAQGRTIIAVLHDISLVRKMFPLAALVARSLIAYGQTENVLTPENLTMAAFNV